MQLDFSAGVFDGTARYLEVGVRPAGFALIKLENKQTSGHSYWLYSGALAIPEDFGIYDENAGDYRIYIKGTNGNVGIGTTDPRAKLDINDDAHVHDLFVFDPRTVQKEIIISRINSSSRRR